MKGASKVNRTGPVDWAVFVTADHIRSHKSTDLISSNSNHLFFYSRPILSSFFTRTILKHVLFCFVLFNHISPFSSDRVSISTDSTMFMSIFVHSLFFLPFCTRLLFPASHSCHFCSTFARPVSTLLFVIYCFFAFNFWALKHPSPDCSMIVCQNRPTLSFSFFFVFVFVFFFNQTICEHLPIIFVWDWIEHSIWSQFEMIIFFNHSIFGRPFQICAIFCFVLNCHFRLIVTKHVSFAQIISLRTVLDHHLAFRFTIFFLVWFCSLYLFWIRFVFAGLSTRPLADFVFFNYN